MRWDNLFDDLESQLEHELAAEDIDVQAEEERLRLGRMSLRDRLVTLHRFAEGREYGIRCVVGELALNIRPTTFGKDWLSGAIIDDSSRSEQVILPFRAIASLVLDRGQILGSVAAPTPETRGVLSARLAITFVLRDLTRRRCAVDLMLAGGIYHGTIDRVGRDHLDLAVHETGVARRDAAVTQYRLVPLDQLLLVRM